MPEPWRRARRRWRWLLGIVLAVSLGLGILASPQAEGSTALAASAELAPQERQLQIADFVMRATLHPDGSVLVQEDLSARFQGSWNGPLRQIPMLANRPGGLEPLGLRVMSITDGDGGSYRYESQVRGRDLELRIFIPEARDSLRRAVITYRVANGLRFYPDHDEFYWNVTGNQWQVPIERVEARVALPRAWRISTPPSTPANRENAAKTPP